MAGPEATVERWVCKHVLLDYGVENVKLKAAGQNGYPDRMFLVPGGRPLMVEFKRPGEGADPLQAHVHDKLRKLGYDVQVHHDRERAIRAIAAALEAAPIPKEGRKVPARARL